MSDGTGKADREHGRVSVERLMAQRETARTERDRLYAVVRELVGVHDGPRDSTYAASKSAAWQKAREAVRRH